MHASTLRNAAGIGSERCNHAANDPRGRLQRYTHEEAIESGLNDSKKEEFDVCAIDL